MRGTVSDEYKIRIMQSTLMEVYHQQYSEIEQMGLEDAMFFMSLHDAQMELEKSILDEQKAKSKSLISRLSRR